MGQTQKRGARNWNAGGRHALELGTTGRPLGRGRMRRVGLRGARGSVDSGLNILSRGWRGHCAGQELREGLAFGIGVVVGEEGRGQSHGTGAYAGDVYTPLGAWREG